MKRRDFLTAVGIGTVATAFLGKTKMAWAAAKAELIDMTKKKRKDPINEAAVAVATGLGYVEVAKESKTRTADKPGKGGATVKAADQYCDNCQFYLDKSPKAQPGRGAPCQMINAPEPGVLVHAKGYCNSWFAKQT